MEDRKGIWSTNLATELEHWRGWMGSAENRLRFEPDFAFLEPDETRWPVGSRIRAIDIGSGPASTIGAYWPGRQISVLSVDPLADEYNALIAAYGYRAHIVKGTGETLLEDVAERDFDYVHSGNALDHCYDPIQCILNMIAIAAPDAFINFAVFENEGKRNDYGGLHQWDFALNEAGRLTLDTEVVNDRMPPGFVIHARRGQLSHGTVIIADVENLNLQGRA